MFKPGEWILYHMPYETLPREKRVHGPAARPFQVVQAWPNEYGPGRHGYNGMLVLDGTNDAQRELTAPGRSGIERFDRLPIAYGYSIPEGTEEGMVSATPTAAEEAASIPAHVNVTGWGVPDLRPKILFQTRSPADPLKKLAQELGLRPDDGTPRY